VTLQKYLFAALRSTFPDASDFRFLIDFPKSGELSVEKTTWTFIRHGAGIAFTSQSGVIVDMHRKFEQPEMVDAWRLLRFLESSSALVDESLNEAQVEAQLRELAESGQLARAGLPGGYRLP